MCGFQLLPRRTREVGVRVALGASSRDIIELVMREGLRPVVLGLAFGVTAATLLRMALQPLFQREISAFDGVALAIAVVPLAVVGLLACYLPARRASRVQPTEALRHT